MYDGFIKDRIAERFGDEFSRRAEGSEEEKLAVFRRVRDEIRTQVEAFLIPG
jgi:hypothetical protein